MAAGQTPEKEATILNLSQDIRKLLGDFQTRLNARFNRTPITTGEGQDNPESPNVLDEIIEELEADKAHLSRIMVFISSDVLPKIN